MRLQIAYLGNCNVKKSSRCLTFLPDRNEYILIPGHITASSQERLADATSHRPPPYSWLKDAVKRMTAVLVTRKA